MGHDGPFPNFSPQDIGNITLRVEGVVLDVAPDLVDCFATSLPDFLLAEGLRHPDYGSVVAGMNPEDAVWKLAHNTIYGQDLCKAAAFCTALAIFELSPKYIDLTKYQLKSFIGMYGADQTMDRGDKPMVEAVGLLDRYGRVIGGPSKDPKVDNRLNLLSIIGANIDQFALNPEVEILREHFYGNVLGNELTHRKLTDLFNNSDNHRQFLLEHGRELAEITTVSAGFPTVSASWYAIFRQQDQTLPELAELYADPYIQKLERVSNVCARLLDEVGDWKMDAGKTDMGIFVVNPFNQYHRTFVDAYCDLGNIKGDRKDILHHSMDNFHQDRKKHTAIVMQLFKEHASEYMRSMDRVVAEMSDGPLKRGYEIYVTLCKRVMGICFVNAIGDPALANPNLRDQ